MKEPKMLAAALQSPPVRPTAVIRSLSKRGPQQARPIACSSCGMRSQCVPSGMRNEDLAEIDQVVTSRRRVKRGEHVHRAGDPFVGIFAFRTGFFKSYVESEDGRTHVTSFQMAGDVSG